METVAVFKLPASPNIVRAGCREPQIPLLFPDYKLLPKQYPPIEYPWLMPRAWPPLTWYNFFSNYLWHFNISLFNFFPNIFFDMRYGYIIFRDHTDALNAPDHNELTYNTTELEMNIAGTTYTKNWGATYTFESQTKDNGITKHGGSNTDWNTAWTQYNAASLNVADVTATAITAPWFVWRYGTQYSVDWYIWQSRLFLSFDTSSLSGETIQTATLKLYINSITAITIELDHIINVYQLAWGDAVGTDDWTGGTLVGTIDGLDLLAEQYNEIDIDTAYINKTGETQFKLAWKEAIDGTKPSDPQTYGDPSGRIGGGHTNVAMGDATENKPTLEVVAS